MYFKGRLMSVFESILLVFIERATMIQFFKTILPIVCSFCRVDWIGCGSEYTELSWIGLDWIGSLSCWIGLDWILQNGPMSNSAVITFLVPQSLADAHWSSAVQYCYQ